MGKYLQVIKSQNKEWDSKNNCFINIESFFTEEIGSGSVWYMDNRFNLDSLINEGYEYCKNNNYENFEIREGNLDNFRILYKSYQ